MHFLYCSKFYSFIEPGETITAPSGIIGTPNWLSVSPPAITDENFYWIVSGDAENTQTITLHFITVLGSSDCSDPLRTNKVMLRSGIDETSPIEYDLCLNEIQMENPYVVEGSALRIEFNTVNSTMYGFIVDFTMGRYNQFI